MERAPGPAVTEDGEWTDGHRLGIPGVDQEHRTFFALLRAVEASIAGADGPGAREALGNLRLYAASHFAHEEEFLEAVGYPDLPRHRAEHAEFMRDVSVLEATPGAPTAVAVRMARAWIGQHILGTDRRYSTWLDETEGPPRVAYPAPAR
jgi:hemerythrin-like metal-binding protein